MLTSLDCIPCFTRQALDAVRLVGADEALQVWVLRRLLREISDTDFSSSPPATVQRLQRVLRSELKDTDPYSKIKQESNRLALELYPQLKRRVARSSDPLDTAVRLAIAGNIMDCAVGCPLSEAAIWTTVKESFRGLLPGRALAEFAAAIEKAQSILYLTDNAGEIVFDRLLIEQMPAGKVTAVVRGHPVINDATIADAQAAGLSDLVNVMDNGSDAPGTILEDCSRAFRHRFDAADLVVAKGQGNYETLSQVKKDIFFVLKVKCPQIAKDIGLGVGRMVLQRSNRRTTTPSGKEPRHAGI